MTSILACILFYSVITLSSKKAFLHTKRKILRPYQIEFMLHEQAGAKIRPDRPE
jgi:hypothetical protein